MQFAATAFFIKHLVSAGIHRKNLCMGFGCGKFAGKKSNEQNS
jgi:hypothetical protein